MIIEKIISYELKVLNKILYAYLNNQKKKLANKSLSIICNNCVAGVLLKDLGLPFNSPTVNLYFFADDYIRFLERLKYYISKEPEFSYCSDKFSCQTKYPIGRIDDVEIHFLHYNSIEECRSKWQRRMKRIEWDNLFVIGSDRDGCNAALIDRFLRLPFKNKVFFSSKRLKRSSDVVYFPEYKYDTQVGDLINDDYAWYFHFNVIKWLNSGIIKKNGIISCLFLLKRKLSRKLSTER